MGYSADGTLKHSQSSDNSYTASISSYSASSGKPRVFTFIHDKSVGKKIYINGLLAATSTDTNNLSGMTTLAIGKSYQGQIGELVIFARSLTDEERQSIEDYLGKKWNSKILRSVGSSSSSGGIGGSCVGGTVSDSGCLTACTVIAATGITDTTVQGGTGSLTCNTTANFTGSLPYTCLNGVFAYTSAATCSCATGYTLSGSTCVTSACSGGTETTATISGTTYKIHTFTSSGSLSCPSSRTGQILVVGGGGGGGVDQGGGGGAGGLIYGSITIGSGTSTITVGSGGAGGINDNDGSAGQDSSLVTNSVTYTGNGGGGGGSYGSGSSTICAGKSGGSGGGGCGSNNVVGASVYASGSNSLAFGHSGGNSNGNWAVGGGGGGGAGGVGGSITGTAPGVGGVGMQINMNGTSTYYAGGGGGGAYPYTVNTAAAGGLGGGGNGGASTGSSAAKYPTAGTNGLGGGGGGCGWPGYCSASAGGSGVVIVRYAQ